MGKIFGQPHRAHRTDAAGHAHPFVDEDHPGLAVFVHIERAVDGVPFRRGDAAAGDVLKRAEGVIGAVDGNTAFLRLFGPYGGENIEFSLVKMAFGRPKAVLFSVKTFAGDENGQGSR